MSFYQAMQQNPSVLKPLIKDTEDKQLKNKYIGALIAKDILCIIFCTIVISSFSMIFGDENSIVGVVAVLSILTYRVSNLGFNTKPSAIVTLLIFAIFSVSPYLASISNPLVGFVINCLSILVIVILSCHNLVLSNQSILVLSYILLYGYKITSASVYINRVMALMTGGLIVATIFYIKNRKVDFNVTFKEVIKSVDLSTYRTKWQLKLAIGVSLGILLGELLHVPRTMWIGAACISMLQPDKSKIQVRSKERPMFVIVGCIMFAIVYLILPKELTGSIGMLGGLILGVTATYKWQTAFNCFGSLASAVPILGLWGAIIFRIVDNVFGVFYSKLFNNLFDKIDEKLSNRKVANEIVNG